MSKKFTISSTIAAAAFLSLAAVTYAAGNVSHGSAPHPHASFRTLTGTVASVQTDSFTLAVQGSSTALYTVSAGSARILKSGTAASSSAIAVSDKVRVVGEVSGTQVTARVVIDGVPSRSNAPPALGRALPHPASRAMFRSFVGTVSSIDGSSFDIRSRQFQGKKNATTTISVATDGSTVWKEDGKPGSISALAVGNMVAVAGTSTASGQLTASKVSVFSNWPFKGSAKH